MKEKIFLRINKLLLFLFIIKIITFHSLSAQNYTSSCIGINLQRYLDIPYLVLYAEVSNRCESVFIGLKDTIFVANRDRRNILNPFYVSKSFIEIPPKKKITQGIIAFRGVCADSLILYLRGDTLSYMLRKLPVNNYDDYKYEAYALALILSVENYTSGDTLVKYYYNNYFKYKVIESIIDTNTYLYYYLKGSLIVAENIFNDNELVPTSMKKICNFFEQAYRENNSDEMLIKQMFNYYIKIARYYITIENYEEALKFYLSANLRKPYNVNLEDEDLFNYAVCLYKRDYDNYWNKKMTVDFKECLTIFTDLEKKNFKRCECNYKLGQIYYYIGYDNKNFEKAEEYFGRVINENCPQQLVENTKKNLKKIEEVKNKKL